MNSLDFALILKTSTTNVRMKKASLRGLKSSESTALASINKLIDWEYVNNAPAPEHTFTPEEVKDFQGNHLDMRGKMLDLEIKINPLERQLHLLRKQQVTVAKLLAQEEISGNENFVHVFKFCEMSLKQRYERAMHKYLKLKIKWTECNSIKELMEQWLTLAGAPFTAEK
jgi:hypothetical protein